MEYSFRSAPGEEKTKLLLDDYGFTLTKGGHTESFAYANIMSVRLTRSHGVFKAYLQADNHRPVVISSQTYSEDRRAEDQSKPYSLFIRVLHHHLKDKSHAVFTSGESGERVKVWAVVAAVLSFVISMICDYLGFSLINPYVQGLALALLMIMVIYMVTAGRMPKTYPPTDIPLQFLP